MPNIRIDPETNNLLTLLYQRQEWRHACGHDILAHVWKVGGAEVRCGGDEGSDGSEDCGCLTDLRGLLQESEPFPVRTVPVGPDEVEYIPPQDVVVRMKYASFCRVTRLIRRDRSVLGPITRVDR